jgi:hypothetical protein
VRHISDCFLNLAVVSCWLLALCLKLPPHSFLHKPRHGLSLLLRCCHSKGAVVHSTNTHEPAADTFHTGLAAHTDPDMSTLQREASQWV